MDKDRENNSIDTYNLQLLFNKKFVDLQTNLT